MPEELLLPASTTMLHKKEVKKQVSEKLAIALEEYKNSFDKKAFGTALKKASKLFAAAIVKKSKQAKPVVASLKKKKAESGEAKKTKLQKGKK